jgi:hypothetical protein
VIEDFDARAVTIKAWSITFSLVALAGAFASHARAVFLVSCVSALLFWFLEGSWKTFQLAYYDRSRDIEDYFRGAKEIEAPFQIGASWYKSWKAGGSSKLRHVLLWPHVALPHLVVAAMGLLLFVLAVSGVLAP